MAYRSRTHRPGRGLAQLALAGFGAGAAMAQSVQGRVVELGDEEPIAGALVALVDSAGGEVARSATSPSGGFVLTAGAAGSYHIVIRQIGQQPWQSAPFALAAGATYPVTFQVEVRPYELPTLDGGGAPLPLRGAPRRVRRSGRAARCGRCGAPTREEDVGRAAPDLFDRHLPQGAGSRLAGVGQHQPV